MANLIQIKKSVEFTGNENDAVVKLQALGLKKGEPAIITYIDDEDGLTKSLLAIGMSQPSDPKIFYDKDKVGTVDAYTKTETDDLLVLKVDKTTTINGKDLSTNIVLTANDVDAYTKTETDTVLSKKQNQLIPINENVILTPNPDGTVGINALDPETFERRISLTMELPEMEMFMGEEMKIVRVESSNVASLKVVVDTVETELSLGVDINYVIPKNKVIIFRVERQLTDPKAYLYIMGQAKRYNI